jgi:hypothetical protein
MIKGCQPSPKATAGWQGAGPMVDRIITEYLNDEKRDNNIDAGATGDRDNG